MTTRQVQQGLLLAGIVWATASPMATGQEPQPVFKTLSDLVVLHVNVFDGRSDAVPGLPQSVFHVLEDNRRQSITFFSSVDVPVAVGLILDSSGSMIARHDMVRAGGGAFVRSSHADDELFTIHFNENVNYGLPPTVPFTNSSARRSRSIDPAARRPYMTPSSPDSGTWNVPAIRSGCSWCCQMAKTMPAALRRRT
jgi:VWFA-related protein